MQTHIPERRTSQWCHVCHISSGHLIGELFRGTLSDDQPMETQLNSMRQKAHILSSLGQPLDDSLVAIAMVISLPQSYSTLRTILMSSNDKLTAETVIAQVLVEEKSRQTSKSHSALACGKTGHVESDCFKKKADEAAKGTGQSSSQALQLFMANSSLNPNSSEWIVDSGAQPVIIGDGRSILATGKGRVEVSMQLSNGTASSTILCDVYYVPDLRR